MKEFGKYTSIYINRKGEVMDDVDDDGNPVDEAIVFDTVGEGRSMTHYFWDKLGTPSVLPVDEFNRRFKKATTA